MKQISLISIVLLLALSTETFPSCETKCPEGYLGVCVEDDNGNCSCECVASASEAAEMLASLMRRAGASRSAIKEGVRKYSEFLSKGNSDFSFVIVDREDHGRTFRIYGSSSSGHVVEEIITIMNSSAAREVTTKPSLGSDDNSLPSIKARVSERPLQGAVLVAGSAPGTPSYADHAVLEFVNFLASKGVRAEDAAAGRSSDATISSNLLEQADQSGAVSVLFVSIGFQGINNMRVECYSAEGGEKVWEEKVSSLFGLSASSMTENFVRRMKKKLEDHIGGSCLPVTGEA